jgi:tRNA threonylcarbamoyl adenosine modification protein (Sua5/YciO/YrdC/YwlC family)
VNRKSLIDTPAFLGCVFGRRAGTAPSGERGRFYQIRCDRRSRGDGSASVRTDRGRHPRSHSARASLLRNGALVAFPTETVYGLGADARNVDALRRLYATKGRPGEHPHRAHRADRGDASLGAQRPPAAQALADAFWPGPLTLVLPRADDVSPLITGGQDSVGLRVPAHPVAHARCSSALPLSAARASRHLGQPLRPHQRDAGATRRRRIRQRRRSDSRRRRLRAWHRVDHRRLHRAAPGAAATG